MMGKMKIIGRTDNVFVHHVLLDDKETHGILDVEAPFKKFIWRDGENNLYMKDSWTNELFYVGYVSKHPYLDLNMHVAEWRNQLPEQSTVNEIPNYTVVGKRLPKERLLKNMDYHRAMVTANLYELQDLLKDNPFFIPDVYGDYFIILYDNPASENHYKGVTSMYIDNYKRLPRSSKRNWLNTAIEVFTNGN